MGDPVIRRGERVIVDGKLIAEVRRDLFRDDLCRPADFEWFITPPKVNEVFDDIPGFRTGPYGQPDVFLSGEWLTERRRKT